MQKIALLESEKHGGKMGAGSAASVALHVAVLAFAIAVTSHAGRDRNRDTAIFIPLPKWQPTVNVVKHASAAMPRRPQETTPRVPAIVVAIPPVIPPTLPGASLTPAPAVTGPAAAPLPGSASGGTDSTAAPVVGNTAVGADAVDIPAAALPGQRGPVYPERLRAMGVDGRVVARFVVERNGRVESEPIILSATAGEFAASVKRYLASARYRPAVIRGQAVRQLAEQEFDFTVGR